MPRYTSSGGGVGGHHYNMNHSGGGALGGLCPGWISHYMAMHMDSIAKILNHVLLLTLVFDVFLFFASFSVQFLPTLGFSPTTLSLLLITEATLLYIMVNHSRISIAPSCLSPTEFKIGLAFGLAVGAAVLSFMVSHAFRNSTYLCDPFSTSTATAAATGSNHTRFLLLNRPSPPIPSDGSPPYPSMLDVSTANDATTAANSISAAVGNDNSNSNPVPVGGENASTAATDKNVTEEQQGQQQPPPPPPPPEQGDDQQQQPPPPPPPPQSSSNTRTSSSASLLSSSFTTPTDFTVLCSAHAGSMGAVWFWAGLSFWCNFVTCLLLWVGKSELSSSSDMGPQYDPVHTYGSGPASSASSHSQTVVGGSFVGDYATVPEIRSDGNNHRVGGGGAGFNHSSSGYGPSGGYSDQPQMTAV
ncbi:hypothetical protein ACA910_020058 [Epithemia clementina (nom. ined.)]